MSDKPNQKPDYEVGYGKPPRESRWPKGTSGNAKGAPKKKEKPLLVNPTRHPTRSIIRSEAARTIVIREGDETKEVPMTQSVMMALGKTALKGGVVAQRTFLTLQMEEDERHHAERKATYEYWSEYKSEAKALIKAAQETGRDLPQILPHPDDIILKYATLEVNIIGPADEEDLEHSQFKVAVRDLTYELSIYLNEDSQLVPGDEEATRIGAMMAVFMIFELHMPPSLKVNMDELHRQVRSRVCGPRREWADHLDEQCQKLGLPCVGYWSETKQARTYPMHFWGMSWLNGRIEMV